MGFHVTIATEADSWFNSHVERLEAFCREQGHEVTVTHQAEEIPEGEIAFLLSLGQIVKPAVLERNRHNIVVHASDLPKGKGWSPVTWQVLEGKDTIPLTLFEAAEEIDAGPIYLRGFIRLKGTELVEEIRALQAEGTVSLCMDFVRDYPGVLANAVVQDSEGESFYPRRRPGDSALDPDKTIREQFDLLRVCDRDRYPAYFDLRGQRYLLSIEKG